MGEKFAANPVTGTASLTIPIAVSPGRSGFGPQLSLGYDSGAGNGPFGLGWSLGLPAITRKTDKGLPRYEDGIESDVFLLSGAEDLVPVYRQDPDGTWVAGHPGYQRDPDGFWVRDPSGRLVVHEDELDGYHVRRYRPRIEGLFARIERWIRRSDGDTFWRSISRDNVTTVYGRTPASRIADPADSRRVFTWLICESFDDKGNAIVYEYVADDSSGVDPSQAHERNRRAQSRSANRYLKRIKYGNTVSRLVQSNLDAMRWLFEAVFEYEEDHYEELPDDAEGRRFVRARPDPPPGATWSVRQDPFSTYRAGFEVRTYRLCRRVLMFHHFPAELGVDDTLVRTTDFGYTETPIASFITSVTHSGYLRQADGAYLKGSLPPLELTYSQAVISAAVEEVDPDSLENLPIGLSGPYQWVDLDGEGVPGILSEQGGGWFYKPNLSPMTTEHGRRARFAPTALLGETPGHRGAPYQFMDLSGDGQLDLVGLSQPLAGFFERTEAGGWESFVPFSSPPNLLRADPNVRLVDLTGDGHADLLIAEDRLFTWYPSLGEEGFAPPETARQTIEEERSPRLVFADPSQSVYLADMSGDGLSDLVRIRNGEVSYWPNLGYGRFGAKVTMDRAPWFDSPDQFDQKRIRLADIDGSGVTDIIYLSRHGPNLYLNQSGNRWSDVRSLPGFPAVDDAADIQVVDLFGNGTACLVWSSPLPGAVPRPMRYVDLMGGNKPHLLVSARNNLGAETHVRYAPSTRFYLEDKERGSLWITRLPFPVHVVELVETLDRVSRNRFVTRYAYHHGYFDGIEREFRGFGLVERWDTEEFAALSESDELLSTANIDAASHVPPALTRTWFHTGAFLEVERISRLFKDEYFRPPGLSDEEFDALLLLDTTLPHGLATEEIREACRALKGSVLREEVYGADGSPKSANPYRAEERSYAIVPLQPRGPNQHAVFLTYPREAIDYQYERDPGDPRIGHSLTLEVDEYGDVLKSAAIAYGRIGMDEDLSPAARADQSQTRITYTENTFTNAVSEPDAHRTPLPAESRTYELSGLEVGNARERLSSEWILREASEATEIPYEQAPSRGLRQKRSIDRVRSLYRRNDMASALPLGELESLALPHESYRLDLTPGLVANIFGHRVTQPMLETEGRYLDLDEDGHWWVPSGLVFYAPAGEDEAAYGPAHFFLPRRYRDPFHTDAVPTETSVRYDLHDLMVEEIRDALGNRVTVGERDLVNPDALLLVPGHDYRVLLPRMVMDPNGNRSEVTFDVLGLVVGTAVMGKREQRVGDALGGFDPDLTDAAVQAHVASPFDDPHAILGQATTRLVYDLFAYARTADTGSPAPPVVYTLARETHDADLAPGETTKLRHAFSYSDGLGREIQQKIQAEAGPLEEGGPDVSPRWVGSGWTIFNNKGKPVREYEPFFDYTHIFRFGRAIGVSPILFYDPLERVVATVRPNHTYEKVVFDAWRQATWDANDTVAQDDARDDADVGEFFRRLPTGDFVPTWRALRTDPARAADAVRRWPDAEARAAEADAAIKAAAHADTPTHAFFDPLGRPFLTLARNRYRRHDAPPGDPPTGERYETHVRLDIEGNQREVVDAKGRAVMRYDFDLLGRRLGSRSMEAGEHLTLSDVAGNPVRAWDSRGHAFRTEYDPLRRPLHSLVLGGDPSDPSREIRYEAIEYGEEHPKAVELNLRTRVFRQYDSAGVVTHVGKNPETGLDEAYDFKGNLLRGSRQLTIDYKHHPDWASAPALEAKVFENATTYDALNRPVTMTSPDGSILSPSYNEANLLESLRVYLRGASMATVFVGDIDYDAKGRRTRIAYGNDATTTYEYDPETFRLLRLQTMRPAAAFPADDPSQPNPPRGVQNLNYAYDPVGNVTRIRDDAQPTVFFRNARVDGASDYVYDAVYRLIAATGGEHLGQNGGGRLPPPTATSPDDSPRVGLLHPADGSAMGRYVQRYTYDEVGNIVQMIHSGTAPTSPGWTRAFEYEEPSLLEPAKAGNRLSRTRVGAITETYDHDTHGNMTRMPHLPGMSWDFRDRLRATTQQVVGGPGTPEMTYYVYDGKGPRVRKVTERTVSPSAAAAGGMPTRMKERIYVGGFEVFREYGPDGSTITLERETLQVTGGKTRVALVETRTRGSDSSPGQLIRYQFDNHLGSVTLELDDQARLISCEKYYPYGGSAYQAVRSQTETPKRYRYSGKERDEENALYFHGARYYACWIARWSSPDPIVGGGTSVYSYVGGNPVNYSDPTGLQSQPRLSDYDPATRTSGGEVPPDTDIDVVAGASIPVTVYNFEDEYVTGRVNRRTPIPRLAQAVVTTAQSTASQLMQSVFALAGIEVNDNGEVEGLTYIPPWHSYLQAYRRQPSEFTPDLLRYRPGGSEALQAINTHEQSRVISTLEERSRDVQWVGSRVRDIFALSAEASGAVAAGAGASGRFALSARVGVVANARGPGTFGPEDVAFGIARPGGQPGVLVRFAGEATPGTRAPLSEATRSLPLGPERNEAVARDTLAFARETLEQSGGRLRFNLSGFSVEEALDPESANYSKTTSAEFRRILNDAFFRERTTFYDPGGADVTRETLQRARETLQLVRPR